MRKVYARQGETRLKHRFLVLKKTIGNESRWLEWATWEEMAETPYRNVTIVYWRARRWVDDIEKYNERKSMFENTRRLR